MPAEPRRASHRSTGAPPGQKPAKGDGSPTFPGDRMHSWGAAHPVARAPRTGTVICVGANRLVGGIESISRDFDTAREANTRRIPPQGSDLASHTPCRCRAACALSRPQGPEKLHLNAGYRISAAHEERARSAGASKWPRRNLNLPLAAGPRVRHIRAHGAVAEWLKAAVC